MVLNTRYQNYKMLKRLFYLKTSYKIRKKKLNILSLCQSDPSGQSNTPCQNDAPSFCHCGILTRSRFIYELKLGK